MNSYKPIWNTPSVTTIDLNQVEEVRVRKGSCIYVIDVDKFIEMFGTLKEIIYDNKGE